MSSLGKNIPGKLENAFIKVTLPVQCNPRLKQSNPNVTGTKIIPARCAGASSDIPAENNNIRMNRFTRTLSRYFAKKMC